MKKLYIAALVICATVFTACQDKNAQDSSSTSERIDSLERVIVQKDNEINDMLSTVNAINEGLRQISAAENRVTIAKDGEGANKNQQIKENIRFISEQMQRNREMIDKLRRQLRESSLNSDQLKKTIDGLVQQLEDKEKEVLNLRAQLDDKDIHIQELDNRVTDLNTNVNALTEENERKAQTISAQDKALNTAFYVFGTKSELKAQNIIEDGKVMQSNFNKSYFTKVDIRVDKEIKLYSKSATLLTSHPASSYTLQRDANKQYILRITNPESFWSTSKYLVILVK
ncbi:MAG: hypothetical protein Q4D33_05455 [Prevotellaceae bacterium]|nr:hypothetical protein [Prevotellaceae bacterium]